MKKIIKYIYILLVACIGLSCENSHPRPDLEEGVNMRVIVDPDKSFIDFSNLGSSKFAFDAYSVNKNLQEVNFITVYYNAAEDSTYDPFVSISLKQSDFKGGKARVELTPQDLVSKLGLPNGINDLGGGDMLSFFTQVKLTNGRVFDSSTETVLSSTGKKITISNSAQSITGNPGSTPGVGTGSSFTVGFNAYIVCPSNIGGTYKVVSNGIDQDKVTHTNVAGVVTLTPTLPGSFVYNVSDISAGVFKTIYAPQYSNAPKSVPFVINDICGKIVIPPGPDGWGDVLSGTGTINGNGTLTIHWETDYDDKWDATYTKQ